MKRIDNVYANICSLENLRAADAIARKGKSGRADIAEFDKDPEVNLLVLHHRLVNKTFRTSAYTTFKVWEPKERLVFWLPYIDQIVHHAVMLQIGGVFTSVFTKDTYSCIKGRGIHKASYALRRALKDKPGTQYCLKIDIKQFYPSVNHDILKQMLMRKIKDQDLLDLLFEIIDSADGLPIGNYLSIAFGNFYLAYFDHMVKEVLGVKYYWRYTDDIVVLAGNKAYLHQLQAQIQVYLWQELRLTLNRKRQVFPVAKSRRDKHGRGIDFVGYVHYQEHTGLRPSIKHNYARMMKRRPNRESIAAYDGWLQHGDCLNLKRKITNGNSKEIQRTGSAIKTVGPQNRDREDIRQGNKGHGFQDYAKQTQHRPVPHSTI
jgi:RNA-directed DNA polymerase